MRSIETEGESIDDAIGNALRALQVERDRVEIEILADATRGLFGFGNKKARVRATVRSSLWAATEVEEPTAVPRETAHRPSPPREPVPQRARPEQREARPVAATDPRKAPAGDRSSAGGEPPSAEFVARSRATLGEILSHIGVSCTVEARPAEEPGTIVLDVNGDTSGLLIGRRGQTLDALEYLVNRILTRADGDEGRVVIDVERYRERRREYLETLARRLADKMKQSGRVVTLNPMSPRDRRIVHLTLQEDAGVVTRSQGDGYYRKMLILPASRSPRTPPPGRSPA